MHVSINALTVKKLRIFQCEKNKILPNVNADLKPYRIMKSECKH